MGSRGMKSSLYSNSHIAVVESRCRGSKALGLGCFEPLVEYLFPLAALLASVRVADGGREAVELVSGVGGERARGGRGDG